MGLLVFTFTNQRHTVFDFSVVSHVPIFGSSIVGLGCSDKGTVSMAMLPLRSSGLVIIHFEF